MTKAQEWMQGAFERMCERRSDIKNHVPRLKYFGEDCEHITEMGIRFGISTYALLAAKPKKYIGYDIKYCAIFDDPNVLACREHIDLQFIKADTRKIEIEETDLLMIDTFHAYPNLKEELRIHSDKASKYIIMHDTVTFAHRGMDGDKEKGLWDALQEFLDEDGCKWKIKEHFTDSNGLTVLERK